MFVFIENHYLEDIRKHTSGSRDTDAKCRYLGAIIDLFLNIQITFIQIQLKVRLMTVIYQKHPKELNAIRFSWIISIFYDLLGKTLGGGRSGPLWYFEAHEYARYLIGLRGGRTV